MRLGPVQNGHEVGELLLVQLTHSTEHSLARTLATKGRPGLGLRLHPYTHHIGSVFPECCYKPVIRVCQQLDDIVIERVHVLHQPLVTGVVHLQQQEIQQLMHTTHTKWM